MPIWKRFCNDTKSGKSIGFCSTLGFRRCSCPIRIEASDSSPRDSSTCGMTRQKVNLHGSCSNRPKRGNSSACSKNTARNPSPKKSLFRSSLLAAEVRSGLLPISSQPSKPPCRRLWWQSPEKNRQLAFSRPCASPSTRNSTSCKSHWTTFCSTRLSRVESRSLSVFIHSKMFG